MERVQARHPLDCADSLRSVYRLWNYDNLFTVLECKSEDRIERRLGSPATRANARRQYLIDAYLMFAASAIAANTFLRSLAGAGFPLFATYVSLADALTQVVRCCMSVAVLTDLLTQMIEGMGVEWAGTLLGCVAFALVPLPILFYLRGAKIREKSTFAPTFPMASQANDAVSGSDVEKDGKVQ